MTPRTATVAAAAVLAGAAASAYLRALHRQLLRERAVARLTDSLHQRDMTALATRIHTTTRQQQVLAAADHIVTRALANHPKEG